MNKCPFKISSLFTCGYAIDWNTFSSTFQAAAKRVKRYIWDIYH